MRVRSITSTLTLALLTAASGCTQIAVYVEHDPDFAFESLQTYDWASAASGASGELVSDRDFDAQMRATVENELARRGYERSADAAPDFLVAYTAALEDAFRTRTIDRYYGYGQSSFLRKAGTSRDYPRTTASRQTAVQEYQQGSVVLDVSLPEPRRLLWRAYARSALDPNEGEDSRERQLREAVRQMLADFPPR